MRCRVHRAVIACRAPMCLNCVRQVRTEMRVTGRIQQIVGCVQEENIVKVMGWVIQLVIVLQGKNDKTSDFVNWVYPSRNYLYMLSLLRCWQSDQIHRKIYGPGETRTHDHAFCGHLPYHWATGPYWTNRLSCDMEVLVSSTTANYELSNLSC